MTAYKFHKWISIFSFLFILSFTRNAIAADFVLKDVLAGDVRIANQRPSLLISELTGDYIKIKNKWFQVRLFSFETRKSKFHPSGTLTFAKVIEKYNLLYLGASPSPRESFYSGYFFYAPRELKLDGITFLLILRPIGDPEMVREIERKVNHKSRKPSS